MVDRPALSTRLDALEGYLAELRSFRSISREDFVREPGLHHLAERYLHLACECILDIAHHLIADLGLRSPSSYRDAVAVLAEENLISESLFQRLRGWMGLRNVLVHLYLEIDHSRTYSVIEQELDDLDNTLRELAPLLER